MVDVLPINFWVLAWALFFIAKNLCSFCSLVVFPAWSQGVNDWSYIWLINRSKAAQIFRDIALWNRCFKWILSAVARTSSRSIVSYCTWSIWHAHRCTEGLLLRLPYAYLSSMTPKQFPKNFPLVNKESNPNNPNNTIFKGKFENGTPPVANCRVRSWGHSTTSPPLIPKTNSETRTCRSKNLQVQNSSPKIKT